MLTILSYLHKVTCYISSPQIVNSQKINNFQYHKLKLYFCTNFMVLLKGNIRYRPSRLDILFPVISCRFKAYVGFFFCVIPCKRFRLLLTNIYVKFECCVISFGKEIETLSYLINVVIFKK